MYLPQIKSRWLAFLIHLLISLVIFLFLAAIIKFTWYPGVLFETEGGMEGIKLIAGVDLVVGPLLTLIVYNLKKKNIHRDLATIGCLQLACLAAGMYTVSLYRPIAIIYANTVFYTATTTQFDSYNIDISSVPVLNNPWPVKIFLELPENLEKRQKKTIDLYRKGDIRVAVEQYRNFYQNLHKVAEGGKTINQSGIHQTNIPAQIWENKSNYKVFSLVTRYDIYKIIVDITTGDIVYLVPELS